MPVSPQPGNLACSWITTPSHPCLLSSFLCGREDSKSCPRCGLSVEVGFNPPSKEMDYAALQTDMNPVLKLKMEAIEDDSTLLGNAVPHFSCARDLVPEDEEDEDVLMCDDSQRQNVKPVVLDQTSEEEDSDSDSGDPRSELEPTLVAVDAELTAPFDMDSDQESGESSESEEEEEEEQVNQQTEPPVVVKQEADAGADGEAEFDRLVENIRLNEGISNAGMLTKDWDFVVTGNAEYRDDLCGASGIGRVRRKPVERSTFGPTLSFQTKALIGEGNQAYVDGDIPGAIRMMLEVLRIEPRATGAWSVLAQCYEEQKEMPKALQLRIMGAHLRGDAEEWDRLAKQSKALGYPQQALYCWHKGYNIDPTNVAALWDCAMLAREIGDLRMTRLALLGILARFPHDLPILAELRPILIELNDLHTCASLYTGAFAHYAATFPTGTIPPVSLPGGVPFGLLDVLILADLHNALGEHERAVDAVRRGVRWLQGRAAETRWDRCVDDREYDLPGRAVARVGADLRADGGEEDLAPGNYTLDINARHRLAIARLKMGDVDEGKVHADIILSEDVLDYAPLFAEIADAYFEIDMFPEARAIYEQLGSEDTTSSVYVLEQTAVCMRMMNELKDCAEVYEAVRKVDPENNDAKMKLAEVYEIMDEPRKALELVYEVMDSRRRRPKDPNAAASQGHASGAQPSLIQARHATGRAKTTTRKPPTNRLSNIELRALEAQKEEEMLQGYRRVKELWPLLHGKTAEGGEENESHAQAWMLEAGKMIETFRETRRLFSTSRVYRGMFPTRRTKGADVEGEEARMLTRLQIDLAHESTARKTRSGDKYNRADVFRGVGFDDWLRIFFKHAFILTERGEYDQADEILRHLLMSAPYHSVAFQDCIRVALMTCASAAGRFHIVVEQSRKLHQAHQFYNEPMRLMSAALGSGLRPIDAFVGPTFQKYLHREMLLLDATANRPESVVWSTSHKRFSINSVCEAENSEDEDGDELENTQPGKGAKRRRPRLPEIAKIGNPVVVGVYGQMCLVAKSYQSAMFYLLMAHDYCQEDPMISLCITVASLGRASQRQCDNRHHLVTQAMAFLARYRQYRSTENVDRHRSEIEYNFGRTFHQLGLYSHAARHYECAIEAADSKDPNYGCAREAAFNLSMIYIATGARHLAVQLSRRWLSI